MQWTKEAKGALSRVPFFVRKRVMKRVEEEAARRGAREVHLDHVRICQERFLSRMEDEVKGYQVETCFGKTGCPNRAVVCDETVERLEKGLSKRDLKTFLKERVNGPLKMHHEFRVSVSDCPNACSRPQIVDLGLIGASRPKVSDEPCSQCGACEETCKEDAISVQGEFPGIDFEKCLACGQCIKVCPTGTLKEDMRGFRVLVGGKLGRHPKLAEELPGIYGSEDTWNLLEKCLDHYEGHCVAGERFGVILERTGIDPLDGKPRDLKKRRA